jgi:hypothetical protein
LHASPIASNVEVPGPTGAADADAVALANTVLAEALAAARADAVALACGAGASPECFPQPHRRANIVGATSEAVTAAARVRTVSSRAGGPRADHTMAEPSPRAKYPVRKSLEPTA